MIKKASVKTTSTAPGATPAVEINPQARLLFRVGAAISFLVGLITYVLTMAPTATFWDAGEFIAASYTLGIPHSPGTPLYVLIGRVATLLPLPFSIAGRVNFISVVAAAGGVLFLYLLVVRFLDAMLGKSVSTGDALVRTAGGLVGALFITFSNTFWANAVESEVYALSTLIMAFATWLGLKWADDPTRPRATSFVFLLFYVLSLSVGLHLGTILAFSGIFFLVLMTPKKTFSNVQFLIACFGMAVFMADATLYRAGGVTVALIVVLVAVLVYNYMHSRSVFAAVCTGLFVLGISVHLYLYIRSGHNPLIDEADPETWRNLYAVLRREQYPTSNIFVRKASFVFQLQHFNGYFQEQFQMAAAYLGKLNLGSLVPLALGVWGIVDHYAKHRRTFVMLFVTFLVMSLGMVIYLNFSDAEVRERDYFYLPAFYYFAVFIGIGAGSILAEIRRAFQEKGQSGMLPTAALAVVLVAMPLFTAKHHWFMHDRSNDYVCPAYARNMLVGLKPNSVLFTNGDNDTFPLWYIQEVEGYRTDVRVVNLSLLNTPWYIKQLRDNEPKLEIKWTDSEINALRPFITQENRVVLVRDLGVQHILKEVAKHRPVYFAVTIPPEVYEPYRQIMEMQGLAYEVVPRRGSNMINEQLLEDNIWNKFDWTGVIDENGKQDTTIYHPPFVRRLFQNYAAAFTQLAFLKSQREDHVGAVTNLERACEIAPDMRAGVLWLGWYMLLAGDTTGAIEYYEGQIAKRPEPEWVQLHYRLAGVYERLDRLSEAAEQLELALMKNPDYGEAVAALVPMLLSMNQPQRALSVIDRWLARHPRDPRMAEMRAQIVAQMQGQSVNDNGAGE